MLDGDKLYFSCGTFKNVFSQLTKNPKVEILAISGQEFMRYNGVVKIVKDEALLEKVRAAMPRIMSLYDQNGWEMGMFYLENGHDNRRTVWKISFCYSSEFDFQEMGNTDFILSGRCSCSFQ